MGKLSRWLIVDALLLACSIMYLFIDLLFMKDVIWAIGALLAVFIFSFRLGEDLRKRGLSP
jgi:hypothetical protein